MGAILSAPGSVEALLCLKSSVQRIDMHYNISGFFGGVFKKKLKLNVNYNSYCAFQEETSKHRA